MITAEQLVQAGIFPEADSQDCLWAESGLCWLKAHTTLPVEKYSPEELPAGAKLFLQKYAEIMEHGGVASESIEGLSQSFSSASTETLLLTFARNLLPEYFSSFSFVPKARQWDY